MTTPPHVLVVEDDPGVAAAMEAAFRRAGWRTSVAPGATAARTALFTGDPDLVLLDVMLPDGDGRELCREIRAADRAPVIMVSARGAEAHKVEGLGLGADDYLVKPFGTAELLARARAVLRRAGRDAPPRALPDRVGGLALDAARRQVTVDGAPVALAPREYAVLLALYERAGRVVTRDDLLACVWGDGSAGMGKALDVQVAGLRRKLGDDAARPRLLHTIRGVGLMLEDAGPPPPSTPAASPPARP